MSNTLKPYLDEIKETLERAFCLRSFPSQISERHDKPEVEMKTSKELLLDSTTINKSDHEKCLIERAINSARVSIKFKYEDADPIEQILGEKFLRFLMKRAEDYVVMRRIPIDGYSISFLVTNGHVDLYSKQTLIDFILNFILEADKEISALKISMNARGRSVAKEYMKLFQS